MKRELQMWSVRSIVAESLPNAIKMVSEHGWEGIEFAGFGDIGAEEMKKLLAENNLYAIGSHTSIDEFENSIKNAEFIRKNF